MSKRIFNIVLCLLLAAEMSAATWSVRKGEAIQKGIDRCATGDTLWVEEGTYYESVILKDGVAIIGRGEVVLDGTNLQTRLISCEADCQKTTLIEHLILQNARHNQQGGAAWLRGKVIMRRCVVRGCSGLQCGGVLIKGDLPEASALGARLEDCLIYNCSATGHYWPDAGGVANFDGTLQRCVIARNYGDRYGGIHSESTVEDCTMWGNRNEYGFVDPTNYVSDESLSEDERNRADEGFEDHFFRKPWLSADNEAADGPHFVDPSTFAGVPETAAEEAIMLAADYRIGATTHRIAKMAPTSKREQAEDYKLYTTVDYTVPSFIQFLMSGDSAALRDKEDPYCMVATINGDPKTRMAFCWFTNEGVTQGNVEIIPTVNRRSTDSQSQGNTTHKDFKNARNKIIIPADVTTTPPLHYAISSSGLLKAAKIDKNTAFRYVSHKALAEGLQPGTAYSWRVGYEGHWSEVGHFRTADEQQGEFSFIYMTDSHIQNKEYVDAARMCADAVARYEKNARFCVFPGDFVDTGTENNSEWEWERWFEEALKPVIKAMPIVPTDGNHDDSPLLNYSYHFNTDTSFNAATHVRPQFAGINYSFTYGDMQLIAFSMQDFWRGEYDEKALTSEYLERDLGGWFKRQVASEPTIRWRVGLVHKNLFSGSDHQRDKETPLLRQTMLPVMKECKINLVLQGHDHCYEVIGPVDSTLYFIGATCGAKRYTPLTREEMEASKHIHHVENYFDLFQQPFAQPGAPSYTRVTVSKEHLLLETFKVLENGKTELFNTIKL
jgi:3',5'-cyclic AMP phosphodiesterase CpdA